MPTHGTAPRVPLNILQRLSISGDYVASKKRSGVWLPIKAVSRRDHEALQAFAGNFEQPLRTGYTLDPNWPPPIRQKTDMLRKY